jgi:hypothetical protein
VPAGHGAQSVDAIAATVVEYRPVTHSVHVWVPEFIWYFPAGQLMHAVDPEAGWYIPKAQLVHAPVAPELAVNFPPEHTKHAVSPVDAAVVPAAQTIHGVLPLAEYWPLGQLTAAPVLAPAIIMRIVVAFFHICRCSLIAFIRVELSKINGWAYVAVDLVAGMIDQWSKLWTQRPMIDRPTDELDGMAIMSLLTHMKYSPKQT